jgi:hypothetical protein
MKHNFGIKKLVEEMLTVAARPSSKATIASVTYMRENVRKLLSEIVYNSHGYTKNIV